MPIYGGVELPDINDVWTDKKTYPYVIIDALRMDYVDAGLYTVWYLHVASIPPKYYKDSNCIGYRDDPCEVKLWTYELGSDDFIWSEEKNISFPGGFTYSICKPPETDEDGFVSGLIWSSHAILAEDGTVYIEGSLPETTPLIDDPFAFLAGWDMARMIIGQRNKYIAPPTLLYSDRWYRSKKYDRDAITKIRIVDSYVPTGDELETWAADEYLEGAINCYILSGRVLIIAGNGAGKMYCNKDSSYLFSEPSGLVYSKGFFSYVNEISGLELLDTSRVTDMEGMFLYCKKLISLDVSTFDTRNVVSMRSMFADCSVLQSLDVRNFDTRKVETMDYMFKGCEYIKTLDLSNFDGSSVLSLEHMFWSCEYLESVDLSGFCAPKVTTTYYMFAACPNLANVEMADFDGSSCTTFREMFCECYKLKHLDVSRWNTGNVTNMARMFYSCCQLESLDVSKWDTKSLTMFASMFYNCYSLKILDMSNWVTSSVNETQFQGMFYKCRSLEAVYVANWDTSQAIYLYSIFAYCESLKSLDISGWDTTKVTRFDSLFAGCTNLTSITVGAKWVISDSAVTTDMLKDCPATL